MGNRNHKHKHKTTNRNIKTITATQIWLITTVGAIIMLALAPTPIIGTTIAYGEDATGQELGTAFINSRAKAKRNNVPYYKDIISTRAMGVISRRESVMIMREEGEFYYVETKDRQHVYVRKADLYQVVNLYQERISPQGYNKKAYYEIQSIIDRFDATFNTTYFNAMPTAPHIALQNVRATRRDITYTILYSGINNNKVMHPSIATNPFREDMLRLTEVVMLKLIQQEDNKNITIEIVVPKFTGNKATRGFEPYQTITLPKGLLEDNKVAIHILKDMGAIWNYANYTMDYFQMYQSYPN